MAQLADLVLTFIEIQITYYIRGLLFRGKLCLGKVFTFCLMFAGEDVYLHNCIMHNSKKTLENTVFTCLIYIVKCKQKRLKAICV